MKYNKEDYNYIKSWLNKCVKIEHEKSIYYVTSPNILRQLKYNRILNKKDIIVDLTKLNFTNNVILRYNIKGKYVFINYFIWSEFELKYFPKNIYEIIEIILSEILKIKNFIPKPEYHSSHFIKP